MSEVVAPILGVKASIVIDFQEAGGSVECALYSVSRGARSESGQLGPARWHESNRWRLDEARHFSGQLEDVLVAIGRAVSSATFFQLALPLSAAGGTVPAPDEP
jgi:hypothetical protein